MKRALAVLTLILSVAVPGGVSAKIDPACSTTTMTSAITGTVQDARGAPVPGMTVELSLTNNPGPTGDTATTDESGFYRICTGHDTYDVHVRDDRPAPVYAGVNQPYTTFANPTGDANFTPASGTPLRYMANLTITPAAISTVAGPRSVIWLARSKAPASTVMMLTLGHRDDEEIAMTPNGNEHGGPANGGWNRWRYSETFSAGSHEALHWASIAGFNGSVRVTQMDRLPYTIDNKAPVLGPATADVTACGPGVTAAGFSPASPPGTTNPMPVVRQGVCDHWSNGARSGLDPFSLTGTLCRDPDLTVACEPINPVLDTYTIVWLPSQPLTLGDYYFGWSIADHAGNRVTNPTGYRLTITDRGGQTPRFAALTPGNLGSGNSLGIVFGSAMTSPSSYPSIGFRITDADGNRDMVPGTLRVRVYYLGENDAADVQAGLVYDYDPSKASNAYDPVSKRGGGTFNLDGGIFQATGYPLQGKPPGRYVASAAITDHGGNTATVSWHWILAAAL